jgi:methylmalonyl-CoA epimerase
MEFGPPPTELTDPDLNPPVMDVLGIDRVIVAAPDLQDAVSQFERLGLSFPDPKDAQTESPAGIQRMQLTYADPGVEILTPEDDENAVATFIDENGPGLYGFVLRVDDLKAAKRELEADGVEPIAEEGSEAAPEAFYHPKDFAGVFLILTEYDHPMLSN